MGDRKKPEDSKQSTGKRRAIRRTRPLCTEAVLAEDIKIESTPPSTSTKTTTVSIEMGRKSTRDKDKKKRGPVKERWLLTRKTWKYMADAGRRLIPEGAQNRSEDVPKIEQYFQHICRTEPRFVLWRRKCSYPGARATSRKLQWRSRGTIPKGIRLGPDPPDEQTQNADFIIGMLKNYLNLNEEKKTTMLLGSKTVRPDQTESPSSQRPGQPFASTSSQTMTTTSLVRPNTSAEMPRSAEINAQIDELLERLRSYSKSCNRSILSPDMITVDILENKALLKKIYTELKKQQLHRILGRHSSGPPNLPHSSSLSTLWNFRRDGSSGRSGDINLKSSGTNLFSDLCGSATGAFRKHAPQPPPPPEKKLSTLGTQTDFIPLHVLQRMAKQYEVQKKEEDKYNRQTDDESDKGTSQTTHQHSRRKSSIDNEDVSQSVSDTIKRYLRMARKKSVADDATNRFKRVNYDRNLRNIRAKGEINPPGMDEGPSKATQTLDAWPVIAINFIRGNDNRKLLEDAHADWHSSLQKRIQQKEEYEEHIRKEEQQRQQQEHQTTEQKDYSTNTPPPPQHQQSAGIFQSGTQFLSNLWHGHHHSGQDSQQQQQQSSPQGTMQKSKSSSNVGQFVSKKIWRSRSKSQTRTSSPSKSEWTPQGNCVWTSASGKTLILSDTHLQDLTDIERKILHRVAIEKINQLNIGVSVNAPGDASSTTVKPQKRRPLLIKRKALTTGFFDSGKKSTKGGQAAGLVFGVSLEKCVDNDNRFSKDNVSSSDRSSRNSVSSLLGGSPKIGSCESLPLRSNYQGPDDSSTMLAATGVILPCRSQSDVRRTSQDDDDLGPGGKNNRGNVQQVPGLVLACIKHLEEHGLHTVGIFRVSTSKKRVRQLKEDFDRGEIIALDPEICPHDVATILKEYLRELPEPLICRNLYKAFVKTQKIRNRRLQLEALSHLLQLLPVAHRDTLYTLLKFLAKIVRASDDITSRDGTILLIGNKMDSNNLATVFAPNILRCTTPGQATTEHEIDDQIDVINVIRTMIDHYEDLFRIPADLLDEVYTNMIDTFPQQLDYLCERHDMHDNDDWDSVASSTPISSPPPIAVPQSQDSVARQQLNLNEQLGSNDHAKRVIYSREDFTHENAAKGDPNGDGFTNRRRDRVSKMKYVESEQEMVRRRRRDRSVGEISSRTSSALSNNSGVNTSAIPKHMLQHQQHNLSSNGGGGNSGSYGDETHSIGAMSILQNSPRRSSLSDNCPRRLSTPFVLHETGIVTASLKIPVHMQGTTTNIFQKTTTSSSSTSGTFGTSGVQSDGKDNCGTTTATSRGSIQLDLSDIPFIEDTEGQCRQSPITGTLSFGGRKDSTGSTTYQIPISYEGRILNTPAGSTATTPESTASRSSIINIPPSTSTSTTTKRSDTAIREVQRKHSSPIFGLSANSDQYGLDNYTSNQGLSIGASHAEPKITASITNIGGAVLKSKTADFERMLTQSKKHKGGEGIVGDDTGKILTQDSNTHSASDGGSGGQTGTNGGGGTGLERSKRSSQGPIYKRQELISSAKRSSKKSNGEN